MARLVFDSTNTQRITIIWKTVYQTLKRKISIEEHWAEEVVIGSLAEIVVVFKYVLMACAQDNNRLAQKPENHHRCNGQSINSVHSQVQASLLSSSAMTEVLPNTGPVYVMPSTSRTNYTNFNWPPQIRSAGGEELDYAVTPLQLMACNLLFASSEYGLFLLPAFLSANDTRHIHFSSSAVDDDAVAHRLLDHNILLFGAEVRRRRTRRRRRRWSSHNNHQHNNRVRVHDCGIPFIDSP